MRNLAITALVVAALAALVFSVSYLSRDDTARPATFPNAYLPVDGGLADLRIVRSSMAQAGPVDIDGTPCWPAYQCSNERCPGRGADGKPFVFAYDYAAKPGGAGPHPHCPRCAAKPGLDPSMITPYLTEEAQAEMAKP